MRPAPAGAMPQPQRPPARAGFHGDSVSLFFDKHFAPPLRERVARTAGTRERRAARIAYRWPPGLPERCGRATGHRSRSRACCCSPAAARAPARARSRPRPDPAAGHAGRGGAAAHPRPARQRPRRLRPRRGAAGAARAAGRRMAGRAHPLAAGRTAAGREGAGDARRPGHPVPRRSSGDYDRQLAGAGGELRSAALALGLFGDKYVANEGDFSADERAHYRQLVAAASRWARPRRCRTRSAQPRRDRAPGHRRPRHRPAFRSRFRPVRHRRRPAPALGVRARAGRTSWPATDWTWTRPWPGCARARSNATVTTPGCGSGTASAAATSMRPSASNAAQGAGISPISCAMPKPRSRPRRRRLEAVAQGPTGIMPAMPKIPPSQPLAVRISRRSARIARGARAALRPGSADDLGEAMEEPAERAPSAAPPPPSEPNTRRPWWAGLLGWLMAPWIKVEVEPANPGEAGSTRARSATCSRTTACRTR